MFNNTNFNVINVSEIYEKYDNTLIIHCISKHCPVSRNKSLVEQIRFSINKSNSCVLNTCTFIFNVNNYSNIFQPSGLGIIIKSGNIINAGKEDLGTTCYNYNSNSISNEHEIYNAIFAKREGSNDITLQDIKILGLYFNAMPSEYNYKELKKASEEFNLQVYFLGLNGLYLTQWIENEQKYIPLDSKELKIKDII